MRELNGGKRWPKPLRNVELIVEPNHCNIIWNLEPQFPKHAVTTQSSAIIASENCSGRVGPLHQIMSRLVSSLWRLIGIQKELLIEGNTIFGKSLFVATESSC